MFGLIIVLPICLGTGNYIPLFVYLGLAFIVWTILIASCKISKEDIC